MLTKLIEKYLSGENYFLPGEVVCVEFKDVLCKESLYLEDHLRIVMKVNFDCTLDDVNFVEGKCIDKNLTTVKQKNTVYSTLPRIISSVTQHSRDKFETACRVITKNLNRPRTKRFRLKMLLCCEDDAATRDFCISLALNTGLDFIETMGRDLVGETSAITEMNLMKMVHKINETVPAVWFVRLFIFTVQ